MNRDPIFPNPVSDRDWLKRHSDICIYEDPLKAFEDGEIVIPEEWLTPRAKMGRAISKALDKCERHPDFKVAAPLMEGAYRKAGSFGG